MNDQPDVDSLPDDLSLLPLLPAPTRSAPGDPSLLRLAERIAGRAEPPVGPNEVMSVLTQPHVADALADVPGVAERVLEWSAQDASFRRGVLARFAEVLRARPMRPRALAEEVYQNGIRALREGDLARARACLEELLPELAPERGVRVYEELFNSLNDPEALTDAVRLPLLPKVLPRDALMGQVAGQRAARWLGVEPAHLEEALALSIAPPYKLLAVTVCLDRHRDATDAVATVLSSRAELLLDVLPRLTDAQAREVFTKVVALKPGRLVEDLMRRADRLPGPLLDFCLETLFLRGEGGIPFARRSWKDLVRILPGGRSSAALAKLVLDRPENEAEGDLVDFLAEVQRSGADKHMSISDRERLGDQVGIEAFLRKPSLDEEKLTVVATELARLPAGAVSAKACERVERTLTDLLWKLPIDPQVALERVLSLLGGPLAGGPGQLYARLIANYKERRDLTSHAMMVHALVALGLGEVNRGELNDKMDPKQTEEFLAVVRKRNGGAEVLRFVEERTRNWSEESRGRWQAVTAPTVKVSVLPVLDAEAVVDAEPVASAAASPPPMPRKRWLGWSDVVLFVGVVVLAIGAAVVWYMVVPPK
jgi:hypothetical protein